MLDAVKLPPHEIAAALVAISFAAGINVYATLATLGLLAHTGVIPLPPSLHVVGSWWVIGASAALFLVEFFADKVPAFDLYGTLCTPLCGYRSRLFWRMEPRPN